jgi:nickel-dependent lactate racemase
MKIHLAYGRLGLDVDVPDRNLRHVLMMRGAEPISDSAVAVREAINAPLGCLPLAEMAAGKRSACIVICDITRPVPNRVLVPALLRALEQGGLPRSRVSILVATGLHRPSTQDELVQMLGNEVLQQCRVVNHRARARDEQRELGQTPDGVPVHIDRTYVEADLKITTGFIEPHLMAGFSGGRKLIAPGCAGEETIKALHRPRIIEDPHCREGIIDGNPLHAELLAIADMAGHDFILNVSLDAERRITGVFAGDPLIAHAAGVAHVREAVSAYVPAPVNIVVATAAGYPLDLTLYQAVKGMTAAAPVLKPGGMLVLAAACTEGLGGEEFVSMATGYSSAESFLHSLQGQPVRVDQWHLEECARIARDMDVVLVADGIPAEQRTQLFIRSAVTVEAALAEGLARYGEDASIAVIPKGPYTLVGVQPR